MSTSTESNRKPRQLCHKQPVNLKHWTIATNIWIYLMQWPSEALIIMAKWSIAPLNYLARGIIPRFRLIGINHSNRRFPLPTDDDYFDGLSTMTMTFSAWQIKNGHFFYIFLSPMTEELGPFYLPVGPGPVPSQAELTVHNSRLIIGQSARKLLLVACRSLN